MLDLDGVNNMKTIEKIKRTPTPPKRLKVAAYARVSMDSVNLMNSLDEQKNYYSKLIKENPHWIFAGIFSDDGISGTGIEKRSGFKKMLEDCEAGKIDLILTKSIQRFARNTVDLLRTVRHLKDIGVEIRFDRENISSFSQEGELMLTILASFAQEESQSISDNVRWAIHKKFQEGQPQCHFRIYGYRWVNDSLVPVPEEARVVSLIFDSYLDGMTMADIARLLNRLGVPTRSGLFWDDDSIRRILKNITYSGNLLLQKQYQSTTFPRKRINNKGRKPMILVENNHEGIVENKTWEKVQEEIKRRLSRGTSWHPTTFTAKIVCGECGSHYHRKLKHGSSVPYWFWTCQGKEKHLCSSVDFKEEIIKAACAYVMKTETFNESQFEKTVKEIRVNGPDSLTFTFLNEEEKTIKWKLSGRRRRLDRTPVTIVCGACGSLYRRKKRRLPDGSEVIDWVCSGRCGNTGISSKDIAEYETLWIDEIWVLSDAIYLHYRDGHTERKMLS